MWRFVPALGVLLVSWSLQQDDGGSLTYWSAFTPLWILFASFSVALALGYIARVYRNAGSSTLWGAQWGVLDKTWSVPPAMLLCCCVVLCCVVLDWCCVVLCCVGLCGVVCALMHLFWLDITPMDTTVNVFDRAV